MEEAFRAIISYYVAGADVIEVELGSGLDARQLYELASSRLMGIEPVEEASGRIVLQVVVDPSTLRLCDAFRRLARTVGFMLSDLGDVVAGRRPWSVLGDIPARDDVVDKLFLFIWRQVFLLLTGRRVPGEVGARSLGDAVLVMTAAKHLERIADHISAMASALADGGSGRWGRLAGHLERLRSLYSEAVRVFERPRLGDAEALLESCGEARRENAELGRELLGGGGCGEAGPVLYTVLHSSRRIVDYVADIAELAMNRVALGEVEARGRG